MLYLLHDGDFAPQLVLTYEVTVLGPDIDGSGSIDLVDFKFFAAQLTFQRVNPD